MVFIYLYILVSVLLVPYYYGMIVPCIGSKSYISYFLNTYRVIRVTVVYILLGLTCIYVLALGSLFYLIIAPICLIVGVYSEKC